MGLHRRVDDWAAFSACVVPLSVAKSELTWAFTGQGRDRGSQAHLLVDLLHVCESLRYVWPVRTTPGTPAKLRADLSHAEDHL